MRHRFFSLWLPLFSVCLVLATVALPEAGAQTSAADQDIPGGHFYTQTNGGVGPQYGYRITDEAGIGFWSEFKRLGGVTALGYPSSRRFTLDGFMSQATQKYILQWRPEVSQVYFVNVFDKLHDLGKDSQLQQQFGIPPQADASIDQATRLGWLNADPAIAKQFGTGPAALQANGLPTSQVTPAGPFSILRAERDAIQHWNVAGPGGITPGTVSVVNGGDVAKTLGLVPGDAAIPETSTGQPAATPTPNAPTPTPTPAFEYKSKQVTDPPVDCNNDNIHSIIPCVAVAANSGTQFIKGRVMDQKGNHLLFIPVTAVITGGATATQVVQTAGDGTFTFFIASGPPGSNNISGSNCPGYSLQYQIFVTTTSGAQDSDVYTVNYDGNCNSDGEFHFDFVKVR